MEATTDDKGKLRETGGRKAIGTKPGSEGWSIKYPFTNAATVCWPSRQSRSCP